MSDSGSDEGNVFMTQVMPIVGTILAIIMGIAPGPDIYKAYKAGSLGSFNVYPNAILFVNCLGWLIYGTLKHDIFIFFPNMVGGGATLLFALVCLPMSNKMQQRVVSAILSGGLTFMSFASLLVLFAGFDLQTSSTMFGFIINIVLFTFYASPAAALYSVIKSRNAAVFSLPIAIASTANSACWTFYGLGIGDVFVSLPNSVGVIVGIAQLICIGVFWKNRGVSNKVAAPSSMQLVNDTDDDDDREEDIEKPSFA